MKTLPARGPGGSLTCTPHSPESRDEQKKKREPQFAPKRDLAEKRRKIYSNPTQKECRIPIRTSACVCVVDGVKL